MIDTERITFPITLNQFTEMQEKEIGRRTDNLEREFFNEVVEISNEVFSAASTGNIGVGARALETADEAMKSVLGTPDSAYYMHLSALLRGWVVLACQQGLQKYATTHKD